MLLVSEQCQVHSICTSTTTRLKASQVSTNEPRQPVNVYRVFFNYFYTNYNHTTVIKCIYIYTHSLRKWVQRTMIYIFSGCARTSHTHLVMLARPLITKYVCSTSFHPPHQPCNINMSACQGHRIGCMFFSFFVSIFFTNGPFRCDLANY